MPFPGLKENQSTKLAAHKAPIYSDHTDQQTSTWASGSKFEACTRTSSGKFSPFYCWK